MDKENENEDDNFAAEVAAAQKGEDDANDVPEEGEQSGENDGAEDSGGDEQEVESADKSDGDDSAEDEPDAEQVAKDEAAYRERMRRRLEQRQEELKQRANNVVNEQDNDEVNRIEKKLAEFDQVIQRQRYQESLKAAEIELETYEKEFSTVFKDYSELVDRAIDIEKRRIMQLGLSERQAEDHLREQKVLLADRAAAQGEDPVEAVYKEAKKITSWFDEEAARMGYVKQGKKQTNLAAQRKASKPNAVSGGAGQGANAVSKTFDALGDDDMEEIKNTTIWDIA